MSHRHLPTTIWFLITRHTYLIGLGTPIRYHTNIREIEVLKTTNKLGILGAGWAGWYRAFLTVEHRLSHRPVTSTAAVSVPRVPKIAREVATHSALSPVKYSLSVYKTPLGTEVSPIPEHIQLPYQGNLPA